MRENKLKKTNVDISLIIEALKLISIFRIALKKPNDNSYEPKINNVKIEMLLIKEKDL